MNMEMYVRDSHKGPLINRGKHPFRKIIKVKQTNPQTTNTLRVVAARSKEGSTAQEAATAHQTVDCGTPRASLRLARGLGAAPRSLCLARGPGAPSGESPSRSRAWRPLGRISASLEGPELPSESPPRSRLLQTHDAAPTPPTGALNAPVHRGRPGQR
jgi:hypothetical protein